MEIQSPPGVFDIMPFVSDEPWRQTHLWQYVEGVIKKLAFDYGFFEFRTPIFERAELFLRGIGEETDIVSKEMYVFPDRGGRELALPRRYCPCYESAGGTWDQVTHPSTQIFLHWAYVSL